MPFFAPYRLIEGMAPVQEWNVNVTQSTDTQLRMPGLSQGKSHRFKLAPDADQRAQIAERQGLVSLRKLSFEGALHPDGKKDWHLIAKLGATLVQPCVVTLEPVSTRIDVDISNRYVAKIEERETGEEMEMPEDESIELIPEVLDLNLVMEEALALHVPLYPRAESAELSQSTFAGPGIDPMQDEDTKPFAGLAELKNKLLKGSPEDEGNS